MKLLLILVSIYIIAAIVLFAIFVQSGPTTIALGYRIQKKTFYNGQVRYYIQQRIPLLFIWVNCVKMVGIETYENITFETEEKAREFINDTYKWIAEVKASRVKKRENINP